MYLSVKSTWPWHSQFLLACLQRVSTVWSLKDRSPLFDFFRFHKQRFLAWYFYFRSPHLRNQHGDYYISLYIVWTYVNLKCNILEKKDWGYCESVGVKPLTTFSEIPLNQDIEGQFFYRLAIDHFFYPNHVIN